MERASLHTRFFGTRRDEARFVYFIQRTDRARVKLTRCTRTANSVSRIIRGANSPRSRLPHPPPPPQNSASSPNVAISASYDPRGSRLRRDVGRTERCDRTHDRTRGREKNASVEFASTRLHVRRTRATRRREVEALAPSLPLRSNRAAPPFGDPEAEVDNRGSRESPARSSRGESPDGAGRRAARRRTAGAVRGDA